MPVKITGFEETKSALRQYARDLADEKACRRVLREACRPLLYLVRQNLRPHRKSGLTEADVDVYDRPRDLPGVVRVAVGGSNRGGGKGRGFILRFLELGTSHNRAYPVLRPAWDSEEPMIVSRIAAGLRKRLGRGWLVNRE